MEQANREKLEALKAVIRAQGRMAVAFSSGVDSTLLAKVAHDVLGADAIAITGRSPAVPPREIEQAASFCAGEDMEHVIVDTHEFEIEGFDHNPPDRCYICKREIFSTIMAAAHERGFEVVAEGSNLDDDDDFRPGTRALRELGVASPLRDAGLNKGDVRALARDLGLAVWDKPASACLNTRFAFGDLLTPERLAMVDAAEQVLRELGFAQVRVRVHGKSARIEVTGDSLERLVEKDMREQVVAALKNIGFAYVALDLQGYRMGSMNEVIA